MAELLASQIKKYVENQTVRNVIKSCAMRAAQDAAMPTALNAKRAFLLKMLNYPGDESWLDSIVWYVIVKNDDATDWSLVASNSTLALEATITTYCDTAITALSGS